MSSDTSSQLSLLVPEGRCLVLALILRVALGSPGQDPRPRSWPLQGSGAGEPRGAGREPASRGPANRLPSSGSWRLCFCGRDCLRCFSKLLKSHNGGEGLCKSESAIELCGALVTPVGIISRPGFLSLLGPAKWCKAARLGHPPTGNWHRPWGKLWSQIPGESALSQAFCGQRSMLGEGAQPGLRLWPGLGM